MIGENIKQARKAKKFSQEELAVRLHVVRQTVSKWEKDLSVPDADVLNRMAELLEVPVSQLLGTAHESCGDAELSERLAERNEQLAALRQKEQLREQAGRKRGLILLLSFAAMVLAMAVRNEVFSIVLTFGCIAAALVILYRNLALLTSVTTEDAQIGPLRGTTVFAFVILLATAVFIVVEEANSALISEKGEKLFAIVLIAAFMLFSGFIAPRLPFNRHTGLRLPWTVQDEDTWNAAHKIVGIISLPAVLLYLAAVWTVPCFEVVSTVVFLLWVGIPAVGSLVFYWEKMHGKL